MIKHMRSNGMVTKLMITDATASERVDGIYPVKLETYKVDLDYIEANLEQSVIQMLDAIDFMIEYSVLNPKA